MVSYPVSLALEPGHEVRQDFLLKKGDVIEGVVVDEAGDPVEGAKVEARMSVGARSVSADAEGRFTVRGIQPGFMIDILAVSHPDYQTETRQRLSMLDGFQTIVLKKTSNIYPS